MLPTPLRAKSLAVSLLVHGSALSAAIVLVTTVPPRPHAPRSLELALARPDAAVAPYTEPPPAATPPIEVPDAEPQLPVVVAPAPQPEPEPWEEPAAPSAEVPPPELLDPSAPFEALPRRLELRPTPPPSEPVAGSEAPPPSPELPREDPPAQPAPAAPAPPPSASSPVPLDGHQPLPDYPLNWARRGWTGEVTIELDVAPDGSVSAARVAASSGFPRLDELARATLARWRFEPARGPQGPVASTFRQRIEFRPR